LIGDLTTAITRRVQTPGTGRQRGFELHGPDVLSPDKIVHLIRAANGRSTPILELPDGRGRRNWPNCRRTSLSRWTISARCAPIRWARMTVTRSGHHAAGVHAVVAAVASRTCTATVPRRRAPCAGKG
jgi:hypothetical protein